MSKKKSHLTLKLGPAKQREIFNDVLLRRYLNSMDKDYFTSDEERAEIIEQLDEIWESRFKDKTAEFANLSAQELEELFEQIDVGFDEFDEELEKEIEEFEAAERAATALIMSIPLREAGFETRKIRFDKDDPFESLTELEQIKVKWAYDVSVRVARYAYEDDKEIRKYLRKEIHGLLSAYIPKQKIIPVRDQMIEDYKDGVLFL